MLSAFIGHDEGRHRKLTRPCLKFDLEVRFTYRADEDGGGGGKDGGGKEEYKTFTFWVRVCAGNIA